MAEPLLLASNSPRRRALLEQLGVLFEPMPAEIEELAPENAAHLSPGEFAWCNASRKSAAVHQLQRGRWVLGADTVVALNETILGKPKTRAQAFSYLEMLSGREHDVITVVVLRAPHSEKIRALQDRSRVTFKALTPDAIGKYLAAVDVMDKAGAYALQENGDWIIENVSGSRDNVIGLPTEALGTLLRECRLR